MIYDSPTNATWLSIGHHIELFFKHMTETQECCGPHGPLADVSCLWNARLGIQTHWSQGAVPHLSFWQH